MGEVVRPLDTAPEARKVQIETLRRMTPSQRLKIASEMCDDARSISEMGARARTKEVSRS